MAAFAFELVTNAALHSPVTSNAITLTGIDAPVAISIIGGQYSLDDGLFTGAMGKVTKGQTVAVRVTTSDIPNTTVQAALTVGGVTGTFSATTMPADITPDAFSFPAITGADLSSSVTSVAITIEGVNTPAPISITNGQYSIAGGAFTSAAGTVTNGQKVVVQLTTSATPGISTQAVLTVGGRSSEFSVTTMTAENTPPAAAIIFPAQNSMVESSTLVVRGTASDSSGIGSIDVNGTAAVYDQTTSSWQAIVPLSWGDNNLMVTVVDNQNNKTTSSLKVKRSVLGDGLSKVRIDTVHNRFVAINNSQLITIDRSNGSVTVVPGDNLSAPVDLQISADGTRALVLESVNNIDSITEINIQTGVRNVVAQDTIAEPVGTYDSIYDMAVDPIKKRLFVADSQSGLIELDLTSGARSVIAAVTGIRGLVWDESHNRIVVTTETSVIAYSPDDASSKVLSNNRMATASSTGNIKSPYGIVLDEAKNLAYVIGSSDNSSIIEIDLSTGSRRLVADRTVAVDTSEVNFEDYRAPYLALDKANNQLLVTSNRGVIGVDIATGTRKWVMKSLLGECHGIKFVPATKTVFVLVRHTGLYSFVLGDTAPTLVSNNSRASAESTAQFSSAWALALDTITNQAYVGDGFTDSIFSVNLQTGRRTTISDNSETGSDNTLINPRSMIWQENEKRVLVLDAGRRSILTVNTDTGERNTITNTFLPSAANSLKSPVDMLISPVSGELLVLDNAIPAVLAVNLTTGARTVFGNISGTYQPWLVSMVFRASDNSIILSDSTNGIFRLTPDSTYTKLISANISQVVYDGDSDNIITLGSDKSMVAGEIKYFNLDTKVFTPIPIAPTGSDEIALERPVDIALDVKANFAYIVDRDSNAIMKVSLINGQRSLFASNLIAQESSNVNFERLVGIDIDLANNRLLVGDLSQSELIAVDLATASRTLITSDTVSATTSNVSIWPEHIAVDSKGKFAYMLSDDFKVIRLDTATGERYIYPENSIATAAMKFNFPYVADIALDESRNRLLVLASDVKSVVAVDLTTGARSEFIDRNIPAQAGVNSPWFPKRLVVDKQFNQLIVVDDILHNFSLIDLDTGLKRDFSVPSEKAMKTGYLSGIDYNPTNNTLILVDEYRDAVIAVDIKTGEAAVLSR